MHTIQHEADPSLEALASRDPRVLQRLVVDQAAEVRRLRQHVAILEAALAVAKASRSTAVTPRSSVAAPHDRGQHASETSEFALPMAPAVAPAPTDAIAAQQPVVDNGADVWNSTEASFEERIAAKAFFGHGSVDEQSRNWLLG